jgi:hypothetical protein
MDGHAGYNGKNLGKRPHGAVVQTNAERRESDAVQSCHWTISLLVEKPKNGHLHLAVCQGESLEYFALPSRR